jgi:hypothetical protein
MMARSQKKTIGEAPWLLAYTPTGKTSFTKKKREWEVTCNRIRKHTQQHKGLIIEATEAAFLEGVLESKYSIVSPKCLSPKAMTQMRRKNTQGRGLKNSLLSVLK